jgi:cytochrome c1
LPPQSAKVQWQYTSCIDILPSAQIKSPDTFKRGTLMPAMQLTDEQLDRVTAYLETLK